MGRMQIQCPTGRIEPVDAPDKLLRKIYRSDTFEGLSSEQVIIGFLMNPSYWEIFLLSARLQRITQAYSLPEGKYIRFFDVFSEDGSYLIPMP